MCIGIAVVALVLASVDRPVEEARETTATKPQSALDDVDAENRLPGTWLREQVEPDARSRRLLRLERDGAFREQVRVVSAKGEVTEHEHAGRWFYDGTNLKRKYTLMNGQPPSRLKLPFATFEIRFESRNEFVGIDHVHRNKVRYQRVPAETEL